MKRSDIREMDTGLFDDIQINNPDRDKAWAAFIKRKDVEAWAVDRDGFPLNGFYDVWCIAWSKGWDGRHKKMKHRKMSEQMEKDIQEIVDFYMQFVTGEHFSIRESLEYFWKCMNDYTIEDYLKTVRERKASKK
jgi:hypothetical protein